MSIIVSVVMPVYNAERFLRQAIESILNQTFADFEFIIVNDGSTDTSSSIIEEYNKRDSRIIVYNLPQNMGIVAAMNSGCKLAQGKYIAVMHSDDISHPQRFIKQVQFLEENLQVGLIGTAFQTIDEQGLPSHSITMPLSTILVRWQLQFNNAISHPTVMMRASLASQVGYYSSDKFPVEDYDLWLRLNNITNIANLPDSLLKYRVWQSSLTGRFRSKAEHDATLLAQDHLSGLLGDRITIETVDFLRSTFGTGQGVSPNDFYTMDYTLKMLERIFRAFIERYPQLEPSDVATVRYAIAKQIYRLSRQSLAFSLKGFLLTMCKATLYTPAPLLDAILRSKNNLNGSLSLGEPSK